MRLIYVSEGNIPSKAANSIQVMKMSQALAKQVEAFELLTSISWQLLFKRSHFDLFKWYGISSPFKVVRIPLLGTKSFPFPNQYRPPRFCLYACLYAFIKRPSFVYTRSLKAASLLLKLGLKVVLEYHAPAEQILLERHLEEMKRDHFLAFVTISDVLATTYIGSGLSSKKVVVLPDGVDLDNFGERLSNEQARHTLRLSQHEKIAIYSGQMLPDKGIDTILQCAQLLPTVSFKMIGGFEELIAGYRRQVLELGLSNVEFLGFVSNSQIPLYLWAADVLLMPNSAKVPSALWTSPLKMFEYMATGKPIVATSIPAIKRILNQDNAILVEPDNAYSLVEGIKMALNDEATAKRIGHQARIDVKDYTWDKRASTILAFIRAIINE